MPNDSRAKKLVITISTVFKTRLRVDFGSFKGLSTAINIVEAQIKVIIKGSKYLWLTIFAKNYLNLLSGPSRHPTFPFNFISDISGRNFG